MFAAITLTFVAPSPALAQSARALLKKGNKLFTAGRYGEAFEVFKQGHSKKPSPVFLRSMALCQLKRQKHEEALKLYNEYISRYSTAKDIETIKSTAKRLATIASTKIEIKSTPPGAKVFVDVEARGSLGVTPTTVTVEPGTHTVLLKASSYRLTTRTIDIKAGGKITLDVPLEVGLSLQSDPPGAEVRIDDPKGKPIGKTPLTPDNAGIPPGKHTVFVDSPGFITYKEQVDVPTGKAYAMSRAVLKLGLKITSSPPGALVKVDNKDVGKTPVDVPVSPGSHDVVLELPGITTAKRTVQAAAGQSSVVHEKFKVGLLSMRTGPKGATVKVGPRDLGAAPLSNVFVPIGQHKVEVTHPGRVAFRRELAFDDTHTIDADIKLGRPSWPFWVSAGVAVAGLAVGAIAGAIALKNANEANDYWVGNADGKGQADGRCTSDGGSRTGEFSTMWLKSDADDQGNLKAGVTPQAYNDDPCVGNGLANASTTGFIVGGVAAAFALVYYVFFQRPSVDIERKARLARARALRRRAAALPVKLPEIH
ncbi:MAG: PEGA domain-containing protein [Myxococcales bacterium]|nr:PEGA domain-containing protein [Myxococcales bacterium]